MEAKKTQRPSEYLSSCFWSPLCVTKNNSKTKRILLQLAPLAQNPLMNEDLTVGR